MSISTLTLKRCFAWTAVLLSMLLVLLVWKWPFRREALLNSLERGTGDRVEFGALRLTYFPPGCVVENVRVMNARTPDRPPLFTARQITIRDSYAAILTARKQVDAVDIVGLHLTIPPPGEDRELRPETPDAQQNLHIDEIRADDGVIEFLPQDRGKVATRIEIRRLLLNNAGKHRQMTFHVAIRSPQPVGEIRSAGRIGPLVTGEIGSTPVSGTYTFQNANLAYLKGVSGFLNSQGQFGGTVREIKCMGTADIPNFHVVQSDHSVHVSSNFTVSTNATTGSTQIESVMATFNHTTILGKGEVAVSPEQNGKNLKLDVSVDKGRLDDLLLVFTGRAQPSMQGLIQLHARITLPSKPSGFLQRLRVEGDFHVRGSKFNNAGTQLPIDRLSASARGAGKQRLPDLARTDFQGHVVAKNGIASLSRVRLSDTGSTATLQGTFNLVTKTVDLKGVLRTQGKLSDTTSGFKSMMLKVMAPLWHRGKSTSVVPFQITGLSDHPHVDLRF